MFRLIEKVQQKPEHARRRVAISVAFFITLFVVVIWLSTVGFRFETGDIAPNTEAPTPVATFFGFLDTVPGMFGGAEDQMMQVTETVEELESQDVATSSTTTTTTPSSTTTPTSSTSTDMATTTSEGFSNDP